MRDVAASRWTSPRNTDVDQRKRLTEDSQEASNRRWCEPAALKQRAAWGRRLNTGNFASVKITKWHNCFWKDNLKTSKHLERYPKIICNCRINTDTLDNKVLDDHLNSSKYLDDHLKSSKCVVGKH